MYTCYIQYVTSYTAISVNVVGWKRDELTRQDRMLAWVFIGILHFKSGKKSLCFCTWNIYFPLIKPCSVASLLHDFEFKNFSQIQFGKSTSFPHKEEKTYKNHVCSVATSRCYSACKVALWSDSVYWNSCICSMFNSKFYSMNSIDPLHCLLVCTSPAPVFVLHKWISTLCVVNCYLAAIFTSIVAFNCISLPVVIELE